MERSLRLMAPSSKVQSSGGQEKEKVEAKPEPEEEEEENEEEEKEEEEEEEEEEERATWIVIAARTGNMFCQTFGKY
ncbi:hypothetical protein V1477_009305 [Vespula maculifrons]|uniref:Uncharacterized protein n=1 Tax=Vespula maculifrons TaxID=7453 RepID=A0ABD2C9E9_VESMC